MRAARLPAGGYLQPAEMKTWCRLSACRQEICGLQKLGVVYLLALSFEGFTLRHEGEHIESKK